MGHGTSRQYLTDQNFAPFCSLTEKQKEKLIRNFPRMFRLWSAAAHPPRGAGPAPDFPKCLRTAFSATLRSPPRRAPVRTAAFAVLSEFRATLPNTRGACR